MKLSKVVIFIIGLYQAFSPLRDNCRFYPTCSSYTKEAIKRYGLVSGLVMGTKRILRCSPFSGFGADFVGVEK